MTDETFTIVGASLAGSRAAEALRREGFEGRIFLLGAEEHPPYDRPPLSKELMLGKMQVPDLLLQKEGFFTDNDIELVLGATVTEILPGEKRVEILGGRSIVSDKVLLATGGGVRRLLVPGAELDNVHYMRTLDDALAIKELVKEGASVVVIGAGFIGAELAASARVLGCQVTMIEVADVPLSRVMGVEMGLIYAQVHRDHGVDLRLSTGVDRLEGEGGVVKRVVTSQGDIIECDVVVVGIGIEPNTSLAELAGLEVGNGIVVNEYCETSLPGVYAAGDVANHPNPILGTRVRLESWQNAQDQGIAAARSMLGKREVFSQVPWFWSDQYDLNLQMAGHSQATDDVVWRGDNTSSSFSVFYLRDGVLVAVLGVNKPLDVRMSQRLIAAGARPDPAALADPSTDLRKLPVE